MKYLKEIVVWLKNPNRGTGREIGQWKDRMREQGLEVKILETSNVMKGDCKEGQIWLVDYEEGIHRLQQLQQPMVGYFHEENENETFWGVSYAVQFLQELDASYFEDVYRRLKGIPWEIASTERCLIRETIPEDAKAFAQIYKDPQMTRYTEGFGGNWGEEEEQIRRYVKRIYDIYGYGIWTIVLKETGEVIGRAGFQDFVQEKEEPYYPQIGYMIAAAHQGKGLAGEVCRGILKVAFEELGFEGVRINVHKDNTPSVRLARRLGFELTEDKPESETQVPAMLKGILTKKRAD